MAAGFMATSSFAQSAKGPVVIKGEAKGVPAMMDNAASAGGYSAHKNTVGGSRWLFPIDVAEAYTGNMDANRFVYLMGYDTTYLQNFTSGASPVNYVAFGQFFDPIYSEGFNTVDPNFFTENDIRITLGNDYTVDSVFFPAAYMEGGKYNSGIDTLIISAAPVAYNDETFRPRTTYQANVGDYEKVAENDSNLLIQLMPSLNKTTRGLNATGAMTWKIALQDTLRKPKTSTGSYPTRNYWFPVNNGTPLNIPKGNGFAFSVTFKPGVAQLSPNADSAVDYNYMMFLAKGSTTNGLSPYYRYSYSDRNMSYLLHYASLHTNGNWISPVELELYNGGRVTQEFILTGAKVTCATCQTLNIKDVDNAFKVAKAYPNPANGEIRVPFILNINSDVKVSLVNAMGQVVKSQNFKNVNNAVAVFNTADLANGMYLYTVEANGQRESGRITVSK